MADLDTGDGGGHKKGRKHVRAKKMSTRIDMTPMVDLAFLLVTFFMLTTTMAKPKTMQLVMPEKDDKTSKDQPKIGESEALTVILDANDKIYYYSGVKDPEVHVTDYTEKGIGKLLDEKNLLARQFQQSIGKKDLGVFVMIKPTDNAKYKNVVDMLDEMKVHNLHTYAIVDVTKDELDMVKKSHQ